MSRQSDLDEIRPMHWLSWSAGARFLGIRVSRLYALVDTGEIPAYSLKRRKRAPRVFVLQRDLEAWRKGQGQADTVDS